MPVWKPDSKMCKLRATDAANTMFMEHRSFMGSRGRSEGRSGRLKRAEGHALFIRTTSSLPPQNAIGGGIAPAPETRVRSDY